MSDTSERGVRFHEHEEVMGATAADLFALLHTPSAIRGWWGASHVVVDPREGGRWEAAWGAEDDPDYITTATMNVFDPPRRIVFTDYQYYSRTGALPFEAELTTEFSVQPREGGAALRVVQSGFPAGPEADDFFTACGAGWRNTFAGIRRFLESHG